MDNNEQSMTSPQKNPTWGPAIGLIIILLLIVAGSLYFFKTNPETENVAPLEEQTNELEGSLEMETDLTDTETENLDEDLKQIETDL